MHGDFHPTLVQKASLSVGHLVGVAVVLWMLGHASGDALRRELLAFCAVVYLFRLMATAHVFVRRSMDWSEVAIVLPWILLIHFTFAYLGGRNAAPAGATEIAGLCLYVAGSYLNTGSEWSRMRWKRGHPGELYTAGLFRLARHVNYFGDSVLFTGYALVTGSAWSLLIPAMMTAGFLGQHIPANEKYLATKYGAAFVAWKQRTAKFVPWLY